MHNFLLGLSRPVKRVLLLSVDAILLPFSLYVAFALRFGTPTPLTMVQDSWTLFPALSLVGVVICYLVGQHRIKLHSFETRAMARMALCAFLVSVSAIVVSYLLGMAAPRSVPLIFGIVFFLSTILARLSALAILAALAGGKTGMAPVAVYGAGAAGIQLVSALRQSHEVKPVVFVDDSPSLHGLIVSGLTVVSPNKLPDMVANGRIEKILLAMPSVSQTRLNAKISDLSELDCEVQILPSYVDMIAGKGTDKSLRTVTPDELLGRDKVELDTPDIAKTYAGRVVMVTGAGGSIGSELCRQLIICRPAHIVLFEQGEFALYQIDRDLRPLAEAAGIKVTTRLGSVTNPPRVASVLADEGVEIVLHAAAYKHVPIVEDNELEGARNNVLGTHIVAEAAQAAGVERFILISTDKAVRPTNIMGATKRMAELVVQDFQTRSPHTKFAMVRFGNVLGSSGSVLPLFERQIRAGGPVTVTHPEVTRFFMTIPEASRLVLLAGAYAEGGDVFVLKMGEPMKIIDIARRMIAMSGRSVKENGKGDIEIQVTGLRPGEKLYEELLINDDSLRGTPHEKIMRAEEAMLSQIEVASMMRELRDILERGDSNAIRGLVTRRVEGYHLQEDVDAG